MADVAFETWGVDESPITIEYSLVVIEEVRHEVSQGMLKFSRGGIEVGGVLYGTRDGRKVRVEAIRPIQCDHSRGPSFQLSDADRAKLETQLQEDAQDTHLQGLICVGWYVSHTRGEISMTDADLEVFASFFRDPWEVTLVVRPGRSGSMRAAFFVWEQDGTVRGSQSYKEFSFPDRLAGVMDASRQDRAETRAGFRTLPPLPAPPTVPRVERQLAAPMSIFEASQYHPSPAPERKKWPYLVGGLALLALLAAIGLHYLQPSAAPEPLGLVMMEREGQLEVRWNSTNRAILRATGGSLKIHDGDADLSVPLSRSELGDGRYLYSRKGGDVEVQMEVNSDAGVQHESSRFLGRPLAPPVNEELKNLTDQKAQLELEVTRLKTENSNLADHIQQLERTRQILETRLGITQQSK
ncbi:MAG: hypothetical protein ABI811_23740 [Acidobacteriota bacterium]